MPATGTSSPAAGNPSPTVTVASGRDAGQSMPIGRSATIGRAIDNTLVLEDDTVSSHHLRIDSTPDGFVVTDLDSTNGTRLNGAPLTGSAPLHSGDLLSLGSTVRVAFAAARPVAAPDATRTLILTESPPGAAPGTTTAPDSGGVGFALPAGWDSEDHTPFFQRRWVRVAGTSVGVIFALVTLVLNLRSTFRPSGGASISAQGTAIPGLSPQDLYNTLLKAPLAAEELPPGFGSPAGARTADSGSGPDQFHALGDAEFDLLGPDTADAIFYTIYPSTTGARGFFNRAAVSDGFKSTGTVSSPGFSNPAKCQTATGTSAGKAIGVTYCLALVGNVVITAQSEMEGAAGHGSGASAISLAKAGATHVQKIGAAAQTPGGVAALLAATPGASTTAAADPRAVFNPTESAAQNLLASLIKAPISAGDLPAGFGTATVTQVDPGEGFKQFRAIGEIEADLIGPDTRDAVFYAVFPTAADASVQFDHSAVAQSSTVTATVTPPGFSHPAKCISLVDSSGRGQTICSVLVGNVQIFGLSILTSGVQRGNVDNATALAKAGVAHLQKVQAGN